jgi:putative ABC transport system ATP-binding protein
MNITAQDQAERPIIELKDITKVYGMGGAMVHALRGIDLSIRKGEFLSIMGPSGSGKSTCMNIMACLDIPTSGTYLFRDVDVGALTRDQRARLRRNYLGFIFQGFNLLSRTSALENVELPLIYRRSPLHERRERAGEALDLVGLKGWENHTPGELSGGQQQRVAIARALMQQPSLILADEPVASLDPATSDSVMRYLGELNREMGLTIICSLYFLSLARAYGSRIVALKGGRMEFDGVPTEIDDTLFRRIYGEDAVEVEIR